LELLANSNRNVFREHRHWNPAKASERPSFGLQFVARLQQTTVLSFSALVERHSIRLNWVQICKKQFQIQARIE